MKRFTAGGGKSHPRKNQLAVAGTFLVAALLGCGTIEGPPAGAGGDPATGSAGGAAGGSAVAGAGGAAGSTSRGAGGGSAGAGGTTSAPACPAIAGWAGQAAPNCLFACNGAPDAGAFPAPCVTTAAQQRGTGWPAGVFWCVAEPADCP